MIDVYGEEDAEIEVVIMNSKVSKICHACLAFRLLELVTFHTHFRIVPPYDQTWKKIAATMQYAMASALATDVLQRKRGHGY